jgi:hypothetical protein
MPVVGLLRNTPSAPFLNVIIALRQGLNEVGFVDGQNVLLEQRWAEGHRLPDRYRLQRRLGCRRGSGLGGDRYQRALLRA